jgi:hypothetical protein
MAATEPIEVKQPRPKILLIDMDNDSVMRLRQAGFNVADGTFGAPFRVTPSGDLAPLPPIGVKLPNRDEQELIVINLAAPEPVDYTGVPHPDVREGCWFRCNRGGVDPRPLAMELCRDAFDRILVNGGLFVLFTRPRGKETYIPFALDSLGVPHPDGSPIQLDNWSFLSALRNEFLEVGIGIGEEMKLADVEGALAKLLGRHLKRGKYYCVFRNMFPRDEWRILARNKYKEPVACSRIVGDRQGFILLLPELSDTPVFLLELVRDVLPGMFPEKFPHAEGASWVHCPAYEHPAVLRMRAQMREIKEEAIRKSEALEASIRSEEQTSCYLHDLIVGTDSILVGAVKRVLADLGFRDVKDVDEEMRKAGTAASLREDLQIHDQRPILVVDVKGVGGCPSDDESLQAQKHVSIRMHEWKTHEVKGLTIINHERRLEPLKRNNASPFRDEILKSANTFNLALITAWDLFRLVRSYKKNGWRTEHVRPLFYRTGRIDIVPTHYQYLGKVVKVWPEKAFGVTLVEGELKPKDRIAIDTDVEFEEQDVVSLMVNNKSVEVARKGDDTGISPLFTPAVMREGARVFRVQRE